MTSLDDAIARAKADAPSRASGGILDILVGGEVFQVEFTRMDPREWIDEKAIHPPREGSKRDLQIGYNPHALALAVAPRCSSLVTGDAPDAREPISAEKWAEIFSVLDAPDIDTISTFLWGINEYEPLQRIVAAKKASRAGRTKQRS